MSFFGGGGFSFGGMGGMGGMRGGEHCTMTFRSR